MAERKREIQRRDKEVNAELDNTAFIYVYFNQKKDNFIETIKVVEETYNDVERRNLLTCFFIYKLD
jgi:hypothetical protein